jgi:hypothetical protein
MKTEFMVTSMAKITKNWLLPDWKRFRSKNDYWTVKDGYHKRWFNKGKWYQPAYNSWLIWKFEKLKEYKDMSFAEDFGHDMPYDGFGDDRGLSYGRSSKNEIETIENVKEIHSTDKAILVEIGKSQYWVPKSKVTLEEGKLKIPEWLRQSLTAVKK